MATDASAKFHKPELIPASHQPEYHPAAVAAHDGLQFWQFMIAGSIAGMVEHMAMFPVDTIKTQMQALGSCPIKSVDINQALKSILKSDGPKGLYRGIAAMGIGAGPAHAVYFSVYELCKKSFSCGNPKNPAAHAAAGVCATVASDAVLTPMDMVKQRLQLSSSPYNGVWDCVRRVLREDGIRGFYASYRTTVLMNAPYTAVHFATYEAAKRGLMEVSPESVADERLVVHATAGALAGALAAALTTPLDVVKTQLQCQETWTTRGNKDFLSFIDNLVDFSVLGSTTPRNTLYRKKYLCPSLEFIVLQGVCGCDRFVSGSIGNVVRTIVKKDGYNGLMRGWTPRMLFHAPAAAICWSTYEAAKAFFQQLNNNTNSTDNVT
ncbi:hypothetical protein BUALT_Bualt13G0096100 [Buddleja alternifolia]|uniref:Mitochondrial carrier protein n=1 Tax=Buddleja alternifolia TaxID=168488 RepID=A0AAV6WX45_9LAMI|nr:hypothetical protein BUALT_Bualt13G0096100 [Buddleja alternifolia]